MNILVAYFSRTNMTKKIAEQIAKELDADIEHITDSKNRSGVLGYIACGREVSLKKTPKTNPIEKKIEDYEIVIIGTPVWAFNMASPIRTYLRNNNNKFKKVAFFATQAGRGADTAFKEMEQLSSKPVATVVIKTKDVVKENYHLKEFLEKIN